MCGSVGYYARKSAIIKRRCWGKVVRGILTAGKCSDANVTKPAYCELLNRRELLDDEPLACRDGDCASLDRGCYSAGVGVRSPGRVIHIAVENRALCGVDHLDGSGGDGVNRLGNEQRQDQSG